jgi:AcrR family transcriptional regulator
VPEARQNVPARGRKAKAAATRARMVEAGYELFVSQGYSPTTMNDVADQAKVAVQTLYFTFHNKPGVLRAVYQFAVLGDHTVADPIGREWFANMGNAVDLPSALRLMVEAMSSIIERVSPLIPAVHLAVDDPETAAWFDQTERLRRDGYRSIIETLTARFPLRSGLTIDDATTILLSLVSPDMYRAMVVRHGWDRSAWQAWTIRTLQEALFARVG